MDRVQAARERLEGLSALAQKAAAAGPPCADCRFKTLLDRCSNPAYSVPSFDPAAGEWVDRFETSVSDARSDAGLCGSEAVLFEAHPPFVVAGRALLSGVKSGGLLLTALFLVLFFGAYFMGFRIG